MRIRPRSSAEKLLDLLQKGARLSQTHAAEQLAVSKRQIRRAVAALRNAGARVEESWEEGEKVYHLHSSQLRIGPLKIDLTEREALAMVVAGEAARATLLPTPLSGPLQTAVQQLTERMDGRVLSFEPEQETAHWHFGSAAGGLFDPDVFDVLSEAIDESRSVRIDYLTASTGRFSEGRKINPLVMGAPGDSWVCVAYCHRRDDLRDFALGGIEAIAPCDPETERAYFDPPEDFDPELYFRDRFRALSGDEVHIVRLLVEPDRAPYFERKRYHPTQQIEEHPTERDDGRMVVSYEVAGLKDVGAWVRSWGSGVKVLVPSTLAKHIAREAEKTARRYTSGSSRDKTSSERASSKAPGG